MRCSELSTLELLTTHYSLLTTYYLLLTTYYLLLTTACYYRGAAERRANGHSPKDIRPQPQHAVNNVLTTYGYSPHHIRFTSHANGYSSRHVRLQASLHTVAGLRGVADRRECADGGAGDDNCRLVSTW